MYDLHDERGVPISAGIPPIVRITAIVGIIGIFCILALVAFNSSPNHAWPASTSVAIPLAK
jgi:hypothetical protein